MDGARGSLGHRFNDASRFAMRHGDIVELRRQQWPAAYKYMAIVTVGSRNSAGFSHVLTQGFRKQLYRPDGCFLMTARVDFLQGDDVGIMLGHQASNRQQIIEAMAANSAMNIPRQDPQIASRGRH